MLTSLFQARSRCLFPIILPAAQGDIVSHILVIVEAKLGWDNVLACPQAHIWSGMTGGARGLGPDRTFCPLLLLLEEEREVGQGSLGMGVFAPAPPRPGSLLGSLLSAGPGLSALGVFLIMTLVLSLEVPPRDQRGPPPPPPPPPPLWWLLFCFIALGDRRVS